MPTLANPDVNVKLLKESRRVEREALGCVKDSERFNARCMNVMCSWHVLGLLTVDAVETAARIHNDAFGHPVRITMTAEFECGKVRTESRR